MNFRINNFTLHINVPSYKTMKSDIENLKSFDEYWHNKGSGISPKIGEELCQYSERVARDAFIQGVQQRTEEEKPEFDFKSKMPVGSVWLGCIALKVTQADSSGLLFDGIPEDCAKEIYHAHQIVKAAQMWNSHGPDSSKKLEKALAAAEQDGVLQNLE